MSGVARDEVLTAFGLGERKRDRGQGGECVSGLERLNGAIELWVRDHGPGVPPEIRDHIFDPYFTTKETGNGLGLSVSREVAARHGGSLEFSCDGDGATFRLRLPATAGESP